MTENELECLDCSEDIFGDDYKKRNGSFNLNVDENELKLEIKHGNKDAEVTIDKNGVSID